MKSLNNFISYFIEHKKYTRTSFFYVISLCHLSATLQTISITVVNLQDDRAVFRIFIALLRFSFDSPSYNLQKYYTDKSLKVLEGLYQNLFCLKFAYLSLTTGCGKLQRTAVANL